MFDSNEILTRLQNGETPDSIAADLTHALNTAIDQHAEMNRVDPDLETAAAALTNYIHNHQPDLVSLGFETLEPEDLESLFEALGPIVPVLKSLKDLEDAYGSTPARGSRASIHPVDEDEAINAFLNKFAR